MTPTFQVAGISVAMLVSYLLSQRNFHFSCPGCGTRRWKDHKEGCQWKDRA